MYRLLNTFSTLILVNIKVKGHLGIMGTSLRKLKFRYVDFKHGELLRQMTQCKLHILTKCHMLCGLHTCTAVRSRINKLIYSKRTTYKNTTEVFIIAILYLNTEARSKWIPIVLSTSKHTATSS